MKFLYVCVVLLCRPSPAAVTGGKHVRHLQPFRPDESTLTVRVSLERPTGTLALRPTRPPGQEWCDAAYACVFFFFFVLSWADVLCAGIDVLLPNGSSSYEAHSHQQAERIPPQFFNLFQAVSLVKHGQLTPYCIFPLCPEARGELGGAPGYEKKKGSGLILSPRLLVFL